MLVYKKNTQQKFELIVHSLCMLSFRILLGGVFCILTISVLPFGQRIFKQLVRFYFCLEGHTVYIRVHSVCQPCTGDYNKDNIKSAVSFGGK